MKRYTYLNASLSVLRRNHSSPEQIRKLQEKRFRDVLRHARENSPLFRELYRDLGEEPALSELPVTTKSFLMKHFDDWVTDPAVTLERCKAFMEDKDNIGRRMDGKYMVCQTSGSTGIPCTVVRDENAHSLEQALGQFRTFVYLTDFFKAILRGAKLTQVCFREFSLEYNGLRRQLLRSPMQKFRVQNVDLHEDLATNIAKLNKFQPAIMSAYPNAMRLFNLEVRAGRLKIHPNILITGGEILTPKLKEETERLLHTRVLDAYGSTESGIIAYMCKEGHMHVNSDWLILEPVDEHDRPVPYGVKSDKVLITNLSNYVQPFIRYEVTDRVIVHKEPCKCGSSFPMIQVEGGPTISWSSNPRMG